MNRTTVDVIVCLCMMIALYINLTDFPKPNGPREVKGPLERIPQ
jgi:hypothetical protein